MIRRLRGQRLPNDSLLYIGLTHADVLPNWLSRESVLGKLANAETEDVGSDVMTTFHNQLSKASRVKGFHRKMSTWFLAVLTWTKMAVACKQAWSWVAFSCHIDTIMHLAEREVIKYGALGIFVSLLCDEILRMSSADWTPQHDSELGSVAEVGKIVTGVGSQLLLESRTHVHGVMKKAGMSDSSSGDSLMAHGGVAVEGHVSSSLTKQLAPLDAFTRKANDAARAMSKEQHSMAARSNAMSAYSDSRSKREQESDKFCDKAFGRQRSPSHSCSMSRSTRPKGEGKGKTGKGEHNRKFNGPKDDRHRPRLRSRSRSRRRR